jgi:carbamoyltransferase
MRDIIIAGFHSGHDCSFGILRNGVPEMHLELERYIRLKEPIDDSLKFLFEKYENHEDIQLFSTGIDEWHGGPQNRFPDTWAKMGQICEKNGGGILVCGHHQAHAANAFYSSNLQDALIITIDGGGEELDDNGSVVIGNFTAWVGNDTELTRVEVLSDNGMKRSANIGGFWSRCTKEIFGLSNGYPYGHQAGSVMAMTCMGDSSKYLNDFVDYLNGTADFNYEKYNHIASNSEQDSFDIAAALQKATEMRVRHLINMYLERTGSRNLCLSGGVVLNCLMVGKMHEWFDGKVDNIFVDPIPYDAGLTLGSARFLWHHILGHPRIKWEDNSTSYLGERHSLDMIDEVLTNNADKIEFRTASDSEVVDLLINKKIVSVFGGGSESGRRALGNRSILADPRHSDTKDIVNERVKHRQWYRPFAPSILREEVSNWFERDVNSPYMSFAVPFREDKRELVPAVVHFDGTARLQTVTENDNSWYYKLISLFNDKTGVPILLNTSFNDREPIVEYPEHALNCFLGTEIDYLYFYEKNILVWRKNAKEDS